MTQSAARGPDPDIAMAFSRDFHLDIKRAPLPRHPIMVLSPLALDSEEFDFLLATAQSHLAEVDRRVFRLQFNLLQ
jgi:hypothetical protein